MCIRDRFYTKTPYRPPRDHIRMLIRCVSRNGNLLLNFPLSEKGTFDDEAVERMQEIGGWLKGKGDSIYGCGAAPLRATPWGSATYKKGHIYLHVFGELHSASAPIFVEGLESKVLSADVLGSGGKVRVRPEGPDVVLTLPKGHRIDPIATVIDLRVAEPVHVAARDFIRQWTVLTPLPGRSFHKPVGPEGRLDAAVPVKFGKKSYPWETVRAGAGGYVDLKAFSPKAYGTTFAATDVVCKRDFATQLLLSATANAAVYLNGTKVLSTRGATPPAPDADKVRITLPKGRSTLVVKSLGRSGPWGFYAWVAGGKQLRFEPTRSVAFVGADPASWQNAAAVIEADKARLLPGTDPLPGTPGLKGCRMRPREPAEATGFIATVNVAKKLENAYVLVRYGHIRDTEIAVAVAGRKPVKVKLPKTGGWRAYKTTLAPFGPLPAGEYPLHVYTTARTGAYHLEALVFAEGTPLGGSLRLQGRP